MGAWTSSVDANRRRIVDDLRRRSILIPKVALPEGLVTRIANRQSLFASKFDAFRLAVEHATLEATRLGVETRDKGKKPYVSFTRLDDDLAPEKPSDKDALHEATRVSLAQLGLADMGLIREFDLCKFSFGYGPCPAWGQRGARCARSPERRGLGRPAGGGARGRRAR